MSVWSPNLGFCAAAMAAGACAATGLAPLESPDPVRVEAYLLAFATAAGGYLVLERRVDGRAQVTLEIAAFDRQTGERRPLGRIDPELREQLVAAWPAREDLPSVVQRSTTGALIAQLGYAWATPLRSGEVDTGHGIARLDDRGEARMHDEASDVRLLALPRGVEVDSHVWLASSAQDRLGLEVAYAGTPAVRSVYVLNVPHEGARLLASRAYAAHVAGDYATAIDLWERALAVDPSEPTTSYNLACAMALAGDRRGAILRLEEAIEAGGDHFRILARRDRDLRSLWERADFQYLVHKRPPAAHRPVPEP